MEDENDHRALVNAWMERWARQLPPDRLLGAFETAFAALWRRAHQTLGDVTLTAIVDRVLYVTSEQYPVFSSLRVEATGLRSEGLHEHIRRLHRAELADGVRFALVEFLTVLGDLTDDILTPALHEELSRVTPERIHDREGARP